MIKESGAWMLRNCYDWDCLIKTNFWEVICDRFYPIEELPSKTRNQIRRCLRDCDIKLISADNLIKANGYNVYKLAFSRYRNIAVNILPRNKWETHIRKHTFNDFWGVFEKRSGQIIAYAMNTVYNDRVNYNQLKAIPDMMNKHYPYFGLLYEMNHFYLEDKKCKYVSDGWRSVTEHSGVQPFLERNFLFRKAYVRMNLNYAIWLKIIVKSIFPFRNLKFIPLSVRNLLKFEEINRLSCF